MIDKNTFPESTATAVVQPTVTPDRLNPNKNKLCVWIGDATKGHWNCGTGPAAPAPQATLTVLVLPTDTASPVVVNTLESEATAVPSGTTLVPTVAPADTPIAQMQLVLVGYYHDVTGKECKKDTPACSPKYEWQPVP